MKEYTIKLSNAQSLALGYVANSQQEWIENAIVHRCSIAMDEIVKICVEKCFAENIPVPNSKDAAVEFAFAKGWVSSLKDTSLLIPKP